MTLNDGLQLHYLEAGFPEAGSGEPVVFRVNMEAGHGGKSGRFRRYREQAEMYAFMLDQLGVGAGK